MGGWSCSSIKLLIEYFAVVRVLVLLSRWAWVLTPPLLRGTDEREMGVYYRRLLCGTDERDMGVYHYSHKLASSCIYLVPMSN
jgi:hypothetical protein